MPDDFIGASGLRPLVTARVMRAWRFLGQPVEKFTLLLDQRVDPCRLLVQKPGNPTLRVERGRMEQCNFKIVARDSPVGVTEWPTERIADRRSVTFSLHQR